MPRLAPQRIDQAALIPGADFIRTRRPENRFSSNTRGSIDIVMLIGSSIRQEV